MTCLMPELPMTEHYSVSPEPTQLLCVTPAARIDTSLSIGTIHLQRHGFQSRALMALRKALSYTSALLTSTERQFEKGDTVTNETNGYAHYCFLCSFAPSSPSIREANSDPADFLRFVKTLTTLSLSGSIACSAAATS